MIRSARHFGPAIIFSFHAQARAQERAIPAWVISLLYELADPIDAGGGCMKLSFDQLSFAEARLEIGVDATKLDRYRNTYIIVADNGTIVTAARTH